MNIDNSAKVRSQLVNALGLDLVGPIAKLLDQLQEKGCKEEVDALREEILDRGPSRWYQTGFLIPSETNIDYRADDTSDDEFAGLDGQNLNRSDQSSRSKAAADDTGNSEGGPARKVFFPSSIGLSFLLANPSDLILKIQWADYKAITPPEDSDSREAWQRYPKESEMILSANELEKGNIGTQQKELPDSNGLFIHWYVRSAPSIKKYPANNLAISLFLTNQRSYDGQSPDDRDPVTAFQVQLDVSCSEGFLERSDPSLSPELTTETDWDQRVNNLHYRNDKEYAIGHNISTIAKHESNKCLLLQTS